MPMNALTKAFANSQRSLIACKASVAQVTSDILSHGPTGLPVHRVDLAKAGEQLRHFKGWVYASIRPIAQRIAGQKIHVGRKISARSIGVKNHQPTDVEPIENHPLIGLLNDPNDLMVAWSLIYTTVASMQLTGRALWWMPKREQILPIPTSWIRGFEGTTSFTAFKVSPPHTGEEYPLPAEECCYFAFPDPADPHGAISPLQACGLAVDADEAIQVSQSVSFRRGIHPTHALIVGSTPSPDSGMGAVRPRLSGAQVRQLIDAVRKRYAGVANHGEPLILDGLIEDVKKLSHSPSEMNWMDSSRLTKERILQGFGVNETIIGSKESNRASATAADKHFIDFTVNPLVELMSQTLTEWLSPMFGGDIVVWIEPCVANDADMMHKWASLLAQHSAITGDELRELSPFHLDADKFPEPVAGRGNDPNAQALADAMEQASKAIQQPVDFSMPYDPLNRIADHIFEGSKIAGSKSFDRRLEDVADELETLAIVAEKHSLNGSHK